MVNCNVTPVNKNINVPLRTALSRRSRQDRAGLHSRRELGLGESKEGRLKKVLFHERETKFQMGSKEEGRLVLKQLPIEEEGIEEIT
jgi:hypothetical protein